jgi:outer membrane lipoprotein-sorting protein
VGWGGARLLSGPRARILLAAAALLLLSVSLAFAASAWQDIWNSESAAKRVSVEGDLRTRTVVGGRELSATAHVHAANGKLRLDYRSTRRQWTLIDDGTRLIRFSPDRGTAVAQPRFSLATDRTLAERNYTARIAGRADVAGRPVRAVEVLPRAGGPVTWRLWLDRETGFVLKRERYNVDGRLTSGTQYTSVQFGVSVSPDVFVIPKDWKIEDREGASHSLSVSELSKQVGFDVVSPRYIPRGFVLQGGYVESHRRSGRVSAELRYTDGLRILNVSQRLRGKDDNGEAESDRGGRRPGADRGEGGGDRRGRGGEGEHERGFGFGRPDRQGMTLVDRGSEKALRYFGKHRVVVAVGDLSRHELVRIVTSVD